jgi:hypothetical protein
MARHIHHHSADTKIHRRIETGTRRATTPADHPVPFPWGNMIEIEIGTKIASLCDLSIRSGSFAVAMEQ